MMEEFLKWKAEQPPFQDDDAFFGEKYGASVSVLTPYFRSILKDLLLLNKAVVTLSDKYNEHIDALHEAQDD